MVALTGAVMTDIAAIREFVAAGRATITIKSLKTETHYTFRINSNKEKDGMFFVKIRTSGGDNDDNDYTYMGIITAPGGFRVAGRSKFNNDSVPVKAFRFFYENVIVKGVIPANLEIRHEGRCGRCGRPLTHPESIDRGIGPECAKHTHR